MLNMNYIGDSRVYPIEFSTISDHVVQLLGDFPIYIDGFTLSRPDHEDNWDYSAYTTIYHEVNGGAQFSNDGSIYVPPEPMPEPEYPDYKLPELTPEEIAEQEQRRKEREAIPTNVELSAAVMELAENISDIEDAIAEIGQMM